MIAVNHVVPSLSSMESWLDHLPGLGVPEARSLVAQALALAHRHYDEDQWRVACVVAEQVAHMHLLPESIAASLLHELPRLLEDWQDVVQSFDTGVFLLLQGVARIEDVSWTSALDHMEVTQERKEQAESLRKMFLAMVGDIRAVIIVLAWRAQEMSRLGEQTRERQIQYARVTMDVFAPLANRLGIWQIKWILEDLALRFLDPSAYKKIAVLLDQKRSERLSYITCVVNELKATLEKEGIRADVVGRPKHIYSIWRKMNKKNLDFSDLYDIRAVRVLVREIKDCYAVLGIIHHIWQPIPGEFDDYISHPKVNAYRSLHTAVVGPQARNLEVQIRTFDMHEHAELGVAAHWRYKEDAKVGRHKGAYEEKIDWLRQLLDWRDNSSLAQAFKTELFEDTVYVITPAGKILSLPMGATPIDFAYAVHTGLGHRCKGAKVDGVMVPLSTLLKTGQRVEILTAKDAHPNVGWIHHGWVKTSRALSKVRQYIRQQNEEHVKEHARRILDRELRKYSEQPSLSKLCDHLHRTHVDAMLLALGHGDLSLASLHQTVRKIQKSGESLPQHEGQKSTGLQTYLKTPSETQKKFRKNTAILVEGLDGVLITLAGCCKPIPPDAIYGFVTRGRGVSVHGARCETLRRLRYEHPERCVEVSWGQHALDGQSYAVDLMLLMQEHEHPFKAVGDLCAREKIILTSMLVSEHPLGLNLRFTIEISNPDKLDQLLEKIRQIPYFISVYRAQH